MRKTLSLLASASAVLTFSIAVAAPSAGNAQTNPPQVKPTNPPQVNLRPAPITAPPPSNAVPVLPPTPPPQKPTLMQQLERGNIPSGHNTAPSKPYEPLPSTLPGVTVTGPTMVGPKPLNPNEGKPFPVDRSQPTETVGSGQAKPPSAPGFTIQKTF